jgi:hypothetical protein
MALHHTEMSDFAVDPIEPLLALDRAAHLLGISCVWQAGLAHFGSLFWPTPGTLKVWETFIPWSSRRWECGNRC